MNWKKVSIEELKEYGARKLAVENLPGEIKQLRSQMVKLGGSSNSTPVKGGGSRWEDRQINLLVKIGQMEYSLNCAKELVANVNTGLSVLSKEERLILDRFYINHAEGNLDRLCGDLHLEKTAVYCRKDNALRRYTLARYGVADI